jgi:hypothetical protein
MAKMADETKITLKMGVIAAGIASLIVMVMGCLWNYHGRLTILETNYNHVAMTLQRIDNTVIEIRDDQIKRAGYYEQARKGK